MADRPIIFGAPMVRALLEGRKTQTRRLLTPQPPAFVPRALDISKPVFDEAEGGWGQWETKWSPQTLGCMGEPQDEVWRPLRGMRWAVGDRLWVKENWRTSECVDDKRASILETPGNGYCWPVWYGADGGAVTWRGSEGGGIGFITPGRPRPSIFMSRWASRLTLTVTDVRVERLQDISEVDAVAEGIASHTPAGWEDPIWGAAGTPTQGFATPLPAYRDLWNSIHGPDAWDANPWVAAVTFDVHRAHIDALPAAGIPVRRVAATDTAGRA